VQLAITGTQNPSLLTAAEHAERGGSSLGLLLRQSRLEVWEETDSLEVEELALVHDRGAAEFYAPSHVVARLLIPNEPGANETLFDSYDRVVALLRLTVPELEELSV
jgi:hypothetical protein